MNAASRGRIVVLGMLTRHIVPGIVWCTMQYVEGLRRLGYDSYYVEPHAGDGRTDSAESAAWVEGVMRRFGFDDRWALDARNGDGRCYGRTAGELAELYRSADVILNLHGSAKATPELCETGRLVYVGPGSNVPSTGIDIEGGSGNLVTGNVVSGFGVCVFAEGGNYFLQNMASNAIIGFDLSSTDKYRFNTTFNCTAPFDGGTALNAEND